MTTLRAAHASADHDASNRIAYQLRLMLDIASENAANDQRDAVQVLAAEASPLLAAAFKPSPDAMGELLSEQGCTRWDRDVATWRTSREQAWRMAAAPMAAQLGFEANIHIDDGPAEHGARGTAHAGVVHLVPALDPEHADARRILAHELVHVAQSRLPVAGALVDAEREADELAAALVRGELPHRPRTGLAVGTVAADTGAIGLFSQGLKSVDTSSTDRRPESERRAERSDNATYYAMNIKLKLLAYELGIAGKKLAFDMSVADAEKTTSKDRVENASGRIMATLDRLDEMARDTARQLDELNTAKGEVRLADGARCLSAALDEFAPVRAKVDDWMAAHKAEPPTWEVYGRGKGILELVFPVWAPGAHSLDNLERSPGLLESESIDSHLDAAISAAQSVVSGNRYQSGRIVLHAKEIAALMVNHAVVTGGWSRESGCSLVW